MEVSIFFFLFTALFLSPIFNSMSNSNRSYKNTNGTRKLNIQDDFPPEIKRNILRSFDSPKDVKNLGETSKGFNLEAKRLQFRTLDLSRWGPKNIDGLIEQLSKIAVRGDHPLSFYVHEVKYTDPKSIKEKQLRAVLNACDQLQVIDFDDPLDNRDWPGVLRTKKQLQHLFLGVTDFIEQNYSFWSLLRTLTTTSPNIETIILKSRMYKEERGHQDTATTSISSRTYSPCRKLEAVLVEDDVWTIPHLKYLTVMAPNLVYACLYLRNKENLTELKSTLEASLKAWSGTLRSLFICNTHNKADILKLRQCRLHPVTFPRMEKLEELVLIGVQISSASLYNLNSLKSLSLIEIDHRDILTTLALRFSRRPVLEKLTKLVVDRSDLYRDVMARRNNVLLYQWRDDYLECYYDASGKRHYRYTGLYDSLDRYLRDKKGHEGVVRIYL